MRIRTLVCSFFVHAAMIATAMVVRIVATTELPAPPHSTTFVLAATTEVPEVKAQSETRREPASVPDARSVPAPIEEPDSFAAVPTAALDTAPSGPGTILANPGNPDAEVNGIAPPPPLPLPAVSPPSPIRVSSVLRAPTKTQHVAPVYPQMARAAGISGIVILEALIAEDGSVRDVKVLRSVPLLDAPAVAAVRQWRFTPTLLNGIAVPVIMTVTVSFTLN